MASEAVESALIEKIQRLERGIEVMKAELAKANAATLEATLGPLRLREAVLLYFGTEHETAFAARLVKDFGPAVAGQVHQHLLDLNHAPLPDGQREALRAAFNGGITKWCA